MTLILFDYDGTLVDSRHMIVHIAQTAAKNLNLRVPETQEILPLIGAPLPDVMQRLFPESSDVETKQLVQEYRNITMGHYDTVFDPDPLFPRVQEMLNHIRNHPLGIVTNMSMIRLKPSLERKGIYSVFSTLQTPDFGPAKPDPDPIHRALRETGHDPHETWMIGDTIYDIQAAKSAGVKAIGVSWGHGRQLDLEKAGADYYMETIDELTLFLKKL